MLTWNVGNIYILFPVDTFINEEEQWQRSLVTIADIILSLLTELYHSADCSTAGWTTTGWPPPLQ
jgi:hypothetical protein